MLMQHPSMRLPVGSPVLIAAPSADNADRRARANLRRPADLTIYEQARRDGYLTIGSRSASRIRLRNAWAQWCEGSQRPYVVVETRQRYAQVELDLIFQRPRPGTSHSVYSTWQLRDATVERIAAILCEHNTTRTNVSAGPVFSYAYRIPFDQAAFVARRLFEIATEDTTEEEPPR
jgi:hypothetical protein